MKVDIDAAAANIKATIVGDRANEAKFMVDEFARTVKELEAENRELQIVDGAFRRSAFDLGPCTACGEPVVCAPEGLALCEQCGEGE